MGRLFLISIHGLLVLSASAGELAERREAFLAKPEPEQKLTLPVSADEILAIGLERTTDFYQNLPAYEVVLMADGTIRYRGTHRSDIVGGFVGMLSSRSAFTNVAEFICASAYFSQPDRRQFMQSHAPANHFVVITHRGEKWVLDPNFDEDMDGRLWALGELIDALVKSATLESNELLQITAGLPYLELATQNTNSASSESATSDSSPPGVVIDHYPAETQDYIGNPSLAILPNGDYLASHDAFGPGHRLLKTYLFRSTDRGKSWTPVDVDFKGQYESSLFVHKEAVYILGGCIVGPDAFVGIRRSEDGGATWTFPADTKTGRLVTGGRFSSGATPILVHKGRLWRAMEKTDPEMSGGDSREYRAFVISAPVDADLLDAASWTVSNDLLLNDFIPGLGWLEGNVVATPEGTVQLMLRAAYRHEQAAVIEVSDDGTTLSFNPEKGFIDFPGGTSKFSIRYDAVSKRYWSVVNDRREEGVVRNKLVLSSSPDLVNWSVERVLLEHSDSEKVGFQYVEWLVDGDDLIFVSRTAWGNAHNFHDANYETFHRVEGFRRSIRPSGER